MPKVISKRETCPKCRNDYRTKDDRRSIVSYGMCCKCLLEKELGHEYIPTTWDCECGKKFMTKKRLDSHTQKFKHIPIYEQGEIK